MSFMPLSAQAQTLAASNAANVQAISKSSKPAANKGHVTILVLDMSGSMSTNDPNNLRCSAANAFIDLSGPGEFVGVVGLDNNTGARNGQFQSALVWAQPTEMATDAERKGLQNIIARKSNNCRPDSTTPTYNALKQAFDMLSSATQGGQIPGSVILLTDGVPAPDTDTQINAIQTDLAIQFKNHGWPIDTVALGQNSPISSTNPATFHDFLGGISSTTSGSFYDDGNGVVPGVSPLNIAPFFVEIFAKRIGRTVKNDIPPTPLNGGTTRLNFDVTSYTKSLDVVVVKDQQATTVVLRTPDGQIISTSGPGIRVSSSDPHYVFFSIEQPQAGPWEVQASGSGQFLLDSLKVSGIGISLNKIALAGSTASTGTVFPLGQPLAITAYLTSNGQQVTDNSYTMSGTVAYTGASGQYSQKFAMDNKATPGTYIGKVTVPASATPGTYNIHLIAFTGSEDAVIASQDQSIRIQRFPLPYFLSPQTGQPTDVVVDSTITQWDAGLQFIYGFDFMQRLSQWPLDNLAARPEASIAGQIELQGQPYTNATVTGEALREGSHDTIPVTVVNDGNGRFHVLFPTTVAGDYILTFKTSGSFADSHGDFGVTTRMVHIIVKPATILFQEFRAWGFTALYLFILYMIFLLFQFFFTPRPFGEWIQSEDGDVVARQPFDQASRSFFQWFFRRNILYSEQIGMDEGLAFRFNRGNSIEANGHGSGSNRWKLNGHGASSVFEEVREVIYSPESEPGENPEESIYTIIPRQAESPSFGENEGNYVQ
jgi:hypothetical protein